MNDTNQQLTPTFDPQPIVQMVLDSLSSPHSKRAYKKALTDFIEWYENQNRPGLSKRIVQAYRVELESTNLSPATINQRMSAIKKLAQEAADNDLIPATLANGISKVKGVKQHGVRAGNWLTKKQAQLILNAPDIATLKGLRDRAILAVMIGGGLRRVEVANLTFAHVAQREGRWAIVDLVGKHNRVRTVPIAAWVKAAVDAWTDAAGITPALWGVGAGRVFRSIHKGGWISGDKMTPQAIRDVAKKYSDELGLNIAAHDLRRSYAKLARNGGAEMEQIQLSLGHASIRTTEVYLGTEQDLTDAPGDRIKLKLEE